MSSLCLLLCMQVFGASAPLSAEHDFVEFGSLQQARDFGWLASNGAKLSATNEAQVGQLALRVDGSSAGKAYQGIRLQRRIDLSNAGPGDRLQFLVNQSFSSALCVNLRLAQGHVYRYVKVKPKRWSVVDVDLDLAQWQCPEGQKWGIVETLSIYAKSFDADGEQMSIDGLTFVVAGKPVVNGRCAAWDIRRWQFPYESTDAWYLGNSDVAWAVDKVTGRILGGWNGQSKDRYVNETLGHYHVEDRSSLQTALETDDRVLGARFDQSSQTVELTCRNPTLRGIRVQKQYRLRGDRLYKRTAFVAGGDASGFITYNSEVRFTPPYRNAGYYMGSGFTGPLVPAPRIPAPEKVTQYRATTKGMLLHQPSLGYGFAHVRTRVDDQFVWPFYSGAIAGYVERMNALYYTPTGWDMSLCTSPLRPDQETSYEEYFAIFRGDWLEFFARRYPSLDPVREAVAQIPPTAAWVKDVKLYTGFKTLARLRRLVEMTEEGEIMVCLSHWGSWGDYYVDNGLVGQEGGFIRGPELKTLIERIKTLSPRIRVGIYNLIWAATHEARVLRKHPEWFRKHNKEGEPLNFFPGCAPNYASLISDDACYQELLGQFDLMLRYLDVDFLYLDIGCAVNMVDWETGRFNRDDLCYRFFLDMKRIVARHGPDKVLFFNGRGNPYADISFVEARSQLRASYWRQFAGMALGMDAMGYCRPDNRMIPLYWTSPLARDYVNRVLALGWIPSLTYGDPIERRAFVQAAYEIGDALPVAGRYQPDWKSDPHTAIESYLVRRHGDRGYLLSLISHETKSRAVPLTIDLSSLDLDRQATVYVIDHAIEDAGRFAGSVTEQFARREYARTGWRHDLVAHRNLVYAGPFVELLKSTLALQPLQLRQLAISTEPAVVLSHDHLPTNYLFARNSGVAVTTDVNRDRTAMTVTIRSSCQTAEVLVFSPD